MKLIVLLLITFPVFAAEWTCGLDHSLILVEKPKPTVSVFGRLVSDNVTLRLSNLTLIWSWHTIDPRHQIQISPNAIGKYIRTSPMSNVDVLIDTYGCNKTTE